MNKLDKALRRIGMVSNQFIPARMVKDGAAALQVVNSQDPGPAAAAEAGGGGFMTT
jgi:hypothetical protein